MPDESASSKPKTKSEPVISKVVTFRRLFALLRPQYKIIGVALILLIASMPCEFFPAVVWRYVADDLAFPNPKTLSGLAPLVSLNGHIHGSFHLLWSALICLFIVYAIGEVTGTLSSVLMQKAAQKFIYIFRNRVYGKLQSQSLGYLQRQRTGDLMSRAMGDVDELQSFIVGSIDQIVGDGAMWFVAVGIVMWLDWRVACFSLAPLVLVYFMLRTFNQKVKPIYTAARDRAGDVSNRLQENLSGITVIKIFGREKEEAERFRQTTWAYYVQQLKAIVARNTFFPLARGVGFLSNVFMIGASGYLLLKYPPSQGGTFTLGKLIMFRAYWYRLFGPVQTLARVNDMVQRAGAAGKRVFDVIDAPEELPDAPDAIRLPNIVGQMRLDHVDFRYTPDAHEKTLPLVLHDINVTIEPGQTVGLCGPSGAGKSTVLNLLMRFYDPAKGQVLLDGNDLRHIQRDDFRSHFALVQQETFLFNDTVLDNIRYKHAEATLEQVVEAAKAANAHGFISALPNGYHTKVGERGVRLSGGQKQRISIARAFLANPAVLLLDEPTSSVEPASEASIIAALNRLMKGRTTVLTSHRPRLINQADLVYVVEDGRVSQRGGVDELRNQPGWFSHFMESDEGEIEDEERAFRPAFAQNP